VINGAEVDPFTFVSSAGGSGLFYGPAMAPATYGAGLDLVYAGGTIPGGIQVAPTLTDALLASVTATTTFSPTNTPGQLPGTFDAGGAAGSGGKFGSDQTIGGTEGNFAGDEEKKDENKTDEATGLKKKEDKAIAKKLSTCS
jgi:hypothetical protein